MRQNNKSHHPESRHKDGYDIDALAKAEPQLKEHIVITPAGKQSIDFKNNQAVFLLNKALLKHHYGVNGWKLVPNSLCPPIPGRADYIHYAHELIANTEQAHVLDIGTGSSLIYPLLGASIYDWNFVATDTHQVSLDNARSILNTNPQLKKKIELRLQPEQDRILSNIIGKNEKFDLVLCNPPFYKSREEHWQKVVKKNEKLHQGKVLPNQNFGGLANELWCKGGEKAFITQYIYESLHLKEQLTWCTSIVSDKDHIKPLVAVLEYHEVSEVKIIPIQHGQKVSRVLAWRLK